MDVLFETCLRGRGDVLMGRCCYVLLRRRHNVSIKCLGDVPLRCLGDVPTSLGASFETYLQRCWDVQRDVVTTSLRRLLARWEPEVLKRKYL